MTSKRVVLDITQMAIVAAIYVALTLLISPLSFGPIQLRFSEVLVLLCFYNKKYIPALTIGCLISNIFSPLGYIDMICGTLATLISCLLIGFTKHLFVATLWPALFNGLIVGTELYFVFDEPIIIAMLQVAAGELIVISILGFILFKALEKNETFKRVIDVKEGIKFNFKHKETNDSKDEKENSNN